MLSKAFEFATLISKFVSCFNGMRRFTKILGFVAISFVLVFISKVNKTGLFTAYVKTIADVEIRNSQAVKFGDAALVAPVAEVKDAPKLAVVFSGGNVATLAQTQLFAPIDSFEGKTLRPAPTGFTPFGLRASLQHTPRAPSV